MVSRLVPVTVSTVLPLRARTHTHTHTHTHTRVLQVYHTAQSEHVHIYFRMVQLGSMLTTVGSSV